MSDTTDNGAIAPADSQAFQRLLKLAFDLHKSGRQLDAEALCRVLLPHLPKEGEVLHLLGLVLQKTGQTAEALRCLELADKVQPKSARILNSLGFVHQTLKNHARAMECYVEAIKLGMNAAATYYSVGNALCQLGELERAATFFRKAVELEPGDAASWNNLGKCLYDLNRVEESIQAYNQAMDMDPQFAMAGYNRALAVLTTGRLIEGFREYNQWRTHGIKPRQFSLPEWHGEPIPGQTLFVHAEQGFGDAIQYSRFIPRVRERVAKVILECRPQLKSLFTRFSGADMVIAFGESIPPFHYFTSIASLPGILGVTLATIPNEVPYLKVLSDGQLPPASDGRLKVGVVWAGDPAHHNNANRSLSLEQFAPVLEVPDIAFYSLQVPVPARDEALFRSLNLVHDLGGQFKSFLDTATAIAELDLVIAVDTSSAHLAGAMGKPVWTLIPFAPDWRWLLEREHTPWYPTMRLFRQKVKGQWAPVIARVVEELARVGGRPSLCLPHSTNEIPVPFHSPQT